MDSLADDLCRVPFFSAIRPAELRAGAPLWNVEPLGGGEILWREGAAVDEIGVVASGALVVEVDGVEVGRVGEGELCGETSGFFSGLARSATLRAVGATRVLTLGTPSLRTLRWQRTAVYAALLDQALRTTAGRVRETDTRISRAAEGSVPAPERSEPGPLRRLWRKLHPHAGAAPDLAACLRQMPQLREVDAEVLAALCRAFVPESVEEGRVVALEGEVGSCAWIVASGNFDVLRRVRGDRAELLASLEPGALFGINTLVERGARTASCVAVSEGWLFRIEAAEFERLHGEARLAFHELVLAALAVQIRGANDALARLSHDAVLEASGRLESTAPEALAGVYVATR